ncbi:MAG: GntR family transcriptional regulator [Chloroflexia bacterium]|nr:GntR family transcriptional regulator [Chloroflexia bacterium]
MSRTVSPAQPVPFQVSPALRHDVRNHLRNQIFDGTLQPGARIVESRLARELGISQTPVREALRELEQMGLVVSYPNRGSSVRRIEPQDAAEMYTLRAHLETMAIQLALPRISDDDLATLDGLIEGMIDAGDNQDPELLTKLDTQFHEFILECSGHRLLLRTWQSISPLNWTMMTVVRLRDRNLRELAERHRPIVEALRARDAGQAERAVREHVLVLGEKVVRDLEKIAESRNDERTEHGTPG